MTYVGRWAPWYSQDSSLAPYADTPTYAIAEEHLAGLAVEDWGCGRGWFRTIHHGGYVGIDGTETQWTDIVADLTTYSSQTPGLFMRHVLEHNPEWSLILDNVLASVTDRLALVVFTPDGSGEQLAWIAEVDVPDIALPHDEIDARLRASFTTVERQTLATSSYYGTETLWLATR